MLSDDTLSITEYVAVEQQGKIQQREQNWLNGASDEESDEDFKWVDTLDEKDELENTYVTFVNETREVMKAGTQAWYCYGNRTNSFLMVHYGFCFKDNLYDSYRFALRLDLQFSKKQQIKV